MNTQLFNSLSTWKDFEQALIPLNKKEKGNAFEQLTKHYFQLDPVHRTFYDEVWLFNEVPSKHLEKLGLPAQDLGIDIIARVGDEYHAIQCKYHSDNNDNVTFREVATFLSLFESNKMITNGYICSSADLTSKNLDKVRSEHISLVLSDTWNNLSNDFFESIKAELDKKKVQLVPYLPKAHQEKALKEAKEYFLKEKHNRGKLIFPCGAGKSLTGFWMTQELGAKSIIVAVPSLSLVKQTLDVYLREIVAHGQKVKWLCICSDEGIGKGDDIAIRTENIGVPCVTDPEYIENWLREHKNESKIIFTTYQSGRIIAEVSKKLNYAFDLGIFDEAHKTVGSDKKLFSHLLFDDNITIEKRIFMTATERFYAGSKDDIISMDNEEIYGETFTQMSFKEAIETGLLTDYKVITIDVKRSEIAEFIQENKLVELNGKWSKETEARSLASMLALRKAMKLFPIHNAVSFHSSIEKAIRNKDLQQFITDSFQYEEIDTFTVSGQMPTTKRNEIVREFADSSKALITNARCLTEGVDVPNIDCIVFADPRKSKVDIVQALGRALRKKDGKDWGYVILPVIYDDTTHEIDNENFNEILAIVRGLASNDERIVEYFQDKNDDQPSNRNDKKDQFQFAVFSEYIDSEELSSELQIKLWEKLSRFNWMPFEEAREYVRSLGFQSQEDFYRSCKSGEIRSDIPYSVHTIYKDAGWISYPDFLGYQGLRREILSYDDAKKIVRTWNIKTISDWRKLCNEDKIPHEIPKRPDSYFKDFGWISWGDWLGTGRRKKGFRTFEEAKSYAIKLDLLSASEWRRFYDSGEVPNDIPKYPNQTYKNDGWISWGDFLGTGRIADHLKIYRSFQDAKAFIQTFNLKDTDDWKKLCLSGNLPKDIPKSPHIVYKENGWSGMYDWIGRKEKRRYGREMHYKSFSDAREFARNLKLKNWNEWRLFAKSGELPFDIPKEPNSVYKENGWLNWGDWLGTNSISSKEKTFLPFEEAKKEVKKLGLKSGTEWRTLCKNGLKPDNLPANPDAVYKKVGWISWGDFLGSGNVANKEKQFLEFEKARNFARNLGLRNEKDWREWKRDNELPDNIPAKPERVYKDKGWEGFGDWLGTGNIANFNKEYLEFDRAREYTRSLCLKTSQEWKVYVTTGQKPENIPANPYQTYKNHGWIDMGDWLGTGRKSNRGRQYWEFLQARNYIRQLALKGQKEWYQYCQSGKKPNEIPSNPASVYKNNGWHDLGDWLGSGRMSNIGREYMGFEEAREIVRSLKLKNQKEWVKFCKSEKRPQNIPSNPNVVFRETGWTNWGDWLGTGKVAASNLDFMSFTKARMMIHELKLKSFKDWLKWCKSGARPKSIPSNPSRFYKSEWKGWADFLGKEK
jgi:superfamily II DNA or RNA helicase